MSDRYEDDMAEEEAIFEQIEAAEPAIDLMEIPSRGGRPRKVDPIKLVAWKQAHKASIAETAKRWRVSPASVKRFARDYGKAAELERQRWQCEKLDEDLRRHEYEMAMMYLGQRNRHLRWVGLSWFAKCEAAKGTAREGDVQAAMDAALAEASEDFAADWKRTMGTLPEHLAR